MAWVLAAAWENLTYEVSFAAGWLKRRELQSSQLRGHLAHVQGIPVKLRPVDPGSVDEWVPSKHSEELCAVLAHYSVPCTVKVYPGSGHAMDIWDKSRDIVMSFIESVTLISTEEQAGDHDCALASLVHVCAAISIQG
jgi:hypothetical protein